MTNLVLVVDDDPVQRRLLEAMVRKFGHDALVTDGGDAALRLLGGPEGARIDVVVLDLVMPDLDGLGVLGKMREMGLSVPVIVQTAHGGIDTVVSAMRAGAADFVVKPVGAERLQVSLLNAVKQKALESEFRRISRAKAGTLTFKDIITRSNRMQAVLRAAEKASGSQIPILVEGESGVGKEMIARAIHGSGGRKAKPFVAVNCGAIPENLVESILFGHEKGAFTGATEKHAGKFVEADSGSLFLDEVGELPPQAQVKLLRAVQEGEVDPLGGRRSIKVDVRFISATNRMLMDEVAAGRFREDLYYRLGVFPITVPPLRDRAEDVPDLARHFIVRFAAEEGKRVRGISGEALAMLQDYRWPGNVRQLENAVFRAVVLCEGDELGAGDFPQIAAQMTGAVRMVRTPEAPMETAGAVSASAPMVEAPSLAPVEFVPRMMRPGPGALDLLGDDGDVRPIAEIEEQAIRFAIEHYRGQMTEVARKLGIGRSTLYRKLKELGLDGGEAESTQVAES